MVCGGYATYGQRIGILVLDSKIPRIPGDLGNATTYPFPVVYKVVQGATISKVVGDTDPALLEPFIQAARELEAAGCKAITTSCGFLALFQKQLAAAVSIPVFTSSLIQIPFVYAMLGPDKKVGVLGAEKKGLTARHFESVGAAGVPVVIGGLDDSDWVKAMRSPNPCFDVKAVENEMVAAAKGLVDSDPAIGALVLECTNMPPYAAAIQAAVKLPVFDIVTMISYVQLAVTQQTYQGYM